MDWLLDRTVDSCSIGVAFGQSSFTDLDFADDVSLLAELLELLVPILETFASDAASLGFEVNWQKTKVQALGCREDMPLTIKVQGQDVMVVEEFVYLGSLIHSSTGSTCDISRRSAITFAAMQSLENQIWRLRLNADAKSILLASPLVDWRRQLVRPGITWLSTIQQDLKQHHLTLPKAADLAQNRLLWRMMLTYGAMQS